MSEWMYFLMVILMLVSFRHFFRKYRQLADTEVRDVQ